jgi:hypothetical protein
MAGNHDCVLLIVGALGLAIVGVILTAMEKRLRCDHGPVTSVIRN